METIKKYTPDFILSILSVFTWVFEKVGLITKRKDPSIKKKEDSAALVDAEVGSLGSIGLGDEPANVNPEPWDYPDIEDPDEVRRYLGYIGEEAMDFLGRGKTVDTIKEVRAITGWNIKESKLFVDACENIL